MEYDVIGGHTLDDLRYDVNQAVKKDGDLKVGYGIWTKDSVTLWHKLWSGRPSEPLSIITPTGFLRRERGLRRSIRPL